MKSPLLRATDLLGECDDVREEVDFELQEVALASLPGPLALDGEDAARDTQLAHLNLHTEKKKRMQLNLSIQKRGSCDPRCFEGSKKNWEGDTAL